MGEESVKRVGIVILSCLTALMFVQPVAAQSEYVVSFTDRSGDLGHPVFLDLTVDPLVPAAYWPETSPVGDAGYLDMIWGEMKLYEDGMLRASLTVAEPVTPDTVLPNSVTEVWWTWFFYLGTGYFPADYAVHLCWDGQEFYSLVLSHEGPLGAAESCSVVGDQVVIEFDSALIAGSVAWFAESICWVYFDPPRDQWLRSGGWFAADLTDGPFLPWLPMPGL